MTAYPVPEIRIQMRLNIITDSGGTVNYMAGPQLHGITANPSLQPAIKSTPIIQPIESSTDEHGPRSRPASHATSERDSDRGHSGRRRSRRRHRPPEDRDRHRNHSQDRSYHGVKNKTSSGRDRPHSHRHRHQSASSQHLRQPHPDSTVGDQSTDTNSVSTLQGYFPHHQSVPIQHEIRPLPQDLPVRPEIRPDPQHIVFRRPEVVPTVGPMKPVYPAFYEPEAKLTIQPENVEMPDELSFNEDLITPPPPVIGLMTGTRPASFGLHNGQCSSSHERQFPTTLPSGHYSCKVPAVSDSTIDSLEVSLDNRFGNRQQRQHAPSESSSNYTDPLSGQKIHRGFAGDFINKWPLKNASRDNMTELAADLEPRERISSTVKHIISSFDPSRRYGQQPGKSDYFSDVEPYARPIGRSAQKSRSTSSLVHIAERPPIPLPRNKKEIETTFGVVRSNSSQRLEDRSRSPSASGRYGSNKSLETEFKAIGEPKRVPSRAGSQHSLQTEFPVISQRPKPDSSIEGSVKSERTREEIEKDLAPILSGLENRLKSMFDDREAILQNQVENLIDQARSQTPNPQIQDEEKPMGSELALDELESRLEHRISGMLLERDASLRNQLRAISDQIHADRRSAEIRTPEPKLEELESRIADMMSKREAALTDKVEKLIEAVQTHTVKEPAIPNKVDDRKYQNTTQSPQPRVTANIRTQHSRSDRPASLERSLDSTFFPSDKATSFSGHNAFVETTKTAETTFAVYDTVVRQNPQPVGVISSEPYLKEHARPSSDPVEAKSSSTSVAGNSLIYASEVTDIANRQLYHNRTYDVPTSYHSEPPRNSPEHPSTLMAPVHSQINEVAHGRAKLREFEPIYEFHHFQRMPVLPPDEPIRADPKNPEPILDYDAPSTQSNSANFVQTPYYPKNSPDVFRFEKEENIYETLPLRDATKRPDSTTPTSTFSSVRPLHVTNTQQRSPVGDSNSQTQVSPRLTEKIAFPATSVSDVIFAARIRAQQPETAAISKASSAAIFDLYTQKSKKLPTSDPVQLPEPGNPLEAKNLDETNSIDDESSSISSFVAAKGRPLLPKGYSSDSTNRDENLDDYLNPTSRLTPVLADSESTTLSRESLVSETSLRADQSAPFYDNNNSQKAGVGIRSVRFREENSDIESSLRRRGFPSRARIRPPSDTGSITSSVTSATNSDVGIPLASEPPSQNYGLDPEGAVFMYGPVVEQRTVHDSKKVIYTSAIQETVEYLRPEAAVEGTLWERMSPVNESNTTLTEETVNKDEQLPIEPQSQPFNRFVSPSGTSAVELYSSNRRSTDSPSSSSLTSGYANTRTDSLRYAEIIKRDVDKVDISSEQAHTVILGGISSFIAKSPNKPTEL